jgi:hypothetical protein
VGRQGIAVLAGPTPSARRALVATVTAIATVILAPATALGAPNDAFSSAQVLSGASTAATGNNGDATKEPGEPNHAGNAGGHSVWWRWTAPADGAVAVDACDSSFDTLLAVYTGDAVGALAGVAANDEGCDGLGQSSLTFVARAGQSYAIAVDGRDGESGDVRLRLRPALKVVATIVKRRNAVDAIRFVIEFAGDDDSDPPDVRLTRNGRTQTFDLDLDGEQVSEGAYTFTFTWSCERHGTWSWRVSLSGASQSGSFTVPKCQRGGWYVSRETVRRGFAGDFGRQAARGLRCRPVGRTRGGKAARWRCTLVRPGLTCRGSFFFRFALTRQGGEIVARKRTPSGSVTCRG